LVSRIPVPRDITPIALRPREITVTGQSGSTDQDLIVINGVLFGITITHHVGKFTNMNGVWTPVPGEPIREVSNRFERYGTTGVKVVISAGDGNDVVVNNAGVPLDVEAGAGDDTIFSGDADDRINGGLGSDFILGQGGADKLFGGAQVGSTTADSADAIITGHDTVVGGAGADLIMGGYGNDHLFDGVDGVNNDGAVDEVWGENGSDKFDIVFASGVPVNQSDVKDFDPVVDSLI
jgi:Ca2+-binding RTX toxin-like protein